MSPLPPLSLTEAAALFRASPLAPAGPWALQALANHRRDPRARQQFVVQAASPVGFLTLGPDLAGYIAQVNFFANAYPELAARTLGTAKVQTHELLLQEFVAGSPLLEAYAHEPAKVIVALAGLEAELATGLTPSTATAAAQELQALLGELTALPLWTDFDRQFLDQTVAPFLHSRLIPAHPQKRVSNGDFLSRNLLAAANGQVHIIDCENSLTTHFHGEDWFRFGYWDELAPAVRAFVDARIPDRPAWTVFFAVRQLVLEARIHGERRARIDASRWCREIKSAFRSEAALQATLARWPDFEHAPRVGVQLFWETPLGWNEPSSQLIEIAPGFHELVFEVAADEIRRLRLDPLDVPGLAIIDRVTVTDARHHQILLDAPARDAFTAFEPAGDARLETAPAAGSLRIASAGNDPQLYFPPLDFHGHTRLRVKLALTANPAAPIPSTAPRSTLLGNVEQITEEAILGWAHDPARPVENTPVDIFLDSRRVATVTAGAFREDLRAAQLGDGRKAFYFNPRPHLTGSEADVRVAFTATGETLPNGTGRLQLASNRIEPNWDAGLDAREESGVDQLARFPRAHWPLISVVMPVYNPPLPFLEAAVASVQAQTYPEWELLLVDDASPNEAVRVRLRELAAAEPRIKVHLSPSNGGISAATNLGFKHAQGAFFALLDHDDELTADALAEVAAVLLTRPDTDVVYTDQDKCDETGRLFQPFHKPAWSPVYFLGVMYVGHLLVARARLIREAGGCDARFDRVQDFELMLRLGEATRQIVHLPKILYHWRTLPGSIALSSHAKGPVDALQVAAVQAHLDRRRLAAQARSHPSLPHRVQLFPATREDPRLVSIIIPSKDSPEHITRCLDSIFRKTTHRRFEVIIVDNGTTDPVAKTALAAHPVQVVAYPGKFNFSQANNLGAQAARGEVLVLLNNDTEIITADWLQIMLTHLDLPGTGAVGPLLLYPDGHVQHAGVALGLRGTCDHVMRGTDPDGDGYGGSLPCSHEVSSLTAACLMVRRSLFVEMGGLEEGYAHIYQDADFCLRLRERGLANLYVANARLHHHESVSRGKDYDFVDRAIFLDRWDALLTAGDPYYNRNFTRNRHDYVPR